MFRVTDVCVRDRLGVKITVTALSAFIISYTLPKYESETLGHSRDTSCVRAECIGAW